MGHEIGSKVACVDADFSKQIQDDPDFFKVFKNLPKQDITYTVRESDGDRTLLEEIVNPDSPIELAGVIVWEEGGFAARRFAPLLENRDSLSEALLNDLEADMLEYEEAELIEVGEEDLSIFLKTII